MIVRRLSLICLGWCLCLASLPAAAAESVSSETDGWRPLFDGTSLQGWRASENPSSFQVVEGTIVADGPRAHLFYVGDVEAAHFQNFEFRAEVRPQAGANSGIFFHTDYQETGFPEQGYEVQINNAAPLRGGYVEHKKTGSLYGVRNQYKSLVQDGQWFTLQIAVRGRRVQIRVNETLVVDFQEPSSTPIDPEHPGRRLSSGTFALQCHDPQSRVAFRNIQVKPLPDEIAEELLEAAPWDAVDFGLAALARDNYPLIDFHTHLKGGLTLEQVLQHTQRTGIGHGVAVNCGLGFPVTDDASALDFLKTLAGQPVFVGMQAEGREWPRMFSPETVARFDYVFTDAMTIIDHRGQRARLWIKEEVEHSRRAGLHGAAGGHDRGDLRERADRHLREPHLLARGHRRQVRRTVDAGTRAAGHRRGRQATASPSRSATRTACRNRISFAAPSRPA